MNGTDSPTITSSHEENWQPVEDTFSRADHCNIPIVRSPREYRAYRISPQDKNYLAIVFDPSLTATSLTLCVEVFTPGGQTPIHRHQIAVEMFFVLKGEGIAFCDGKRVRLRTGDSLLVPPTGIHQIVNNSSERLYLLCFMVPNEDFVELIRSGTPVPLDEADLSVLSRTDGWVQTL